MSETGTSVTKTKPLANSPIVADLGHPGMDRNSTSPLIHTKLHRPPLPSDYVCRDRLFNQMDKATNVPLTVVSAGAGTGKSVMVAAWLEDRNLPHVWLSLDKADGNLQRFLSYLVTGMESVIPQGLQETTRLLHSKELPPVSVMATYLVNEIDQDTTQRIVVLDDYHALDRNSPVHELIGCWLNHPPRNCHLVLVAREDPPLPLASLRGGGRINEIRQQDLAFSVAETENLLVNSVQVEFSTAQVESIQLTVEGWAVGLRLVALACQKASDVDKFIAQLGGNLPDTTAYLMEEVLSNLPTAFKGYLIKTAVLNRFCPALLDAIRPDTGSAAADIDGAQIIEHLNRANLFVVPLDTKSEWFRYHHLFQELLLDSLRQICSHEEIRSLHINASNWFEQQGFIEEAIEHAIAAEDQQAAADIVERHRSKPLSADRWWELKNWLDMLDADVEQSRPALLMSEGWLSYFRLDLDEMARLVKKFDALANEVFDPMILAERAFFAATLAYWDGNHAESLRLIESTEAYLPSERQMVAGESHLIRALGQHMNGNTPLALRELKSDLKKAHKDSHLFVTRIMAGISFVHLLNSDLKHALDTARQLIEVAEHPDLPYAIPWGNLLSGISLFHTGRFDQAKKPLSFCLDHVYGFQKRAAADVFAGLALCEQFTGHPQQATTTLQKGAAITDEYRDAESSDEITACQARLQLLQGNTRAALRWARVTDTDFYPSHMFVWVENPVITRHRIFIAAGTTDECKKSFDDLGDMLSELKALNMNNQVVQVALLKAIAAEKLGLPTEAAAALGECIKLAEPGEWIQPFVEAGEPLIGMLKSISKAGHHREFVRSVLVAYDKYAAASKQDMGAGGATQLVPDHDRLTDLTKREFDILELIAQRLQNKEIAARLNISTHTVKHHVKHLYQKLDVSNRREAASKAMRLGILQENELGLKSRPL